MSKALSAGALRWAAAVGTLVLTALAGGIVATAPKPNDAPLHPAVKSLPNNASVQSQSYVS